MKNKGDKGEVTVSVRSSTGKRKGESAEKVFAEEIGEKEAKRMRKGMRKMMR